MSVALEKLCGVFEDELERQENVLRLCLLQEEAVMQRNPARLTTHTEALNFLLNEVAAAEGERLRIAREAVEALGLKEGKQSLSGVIAHAPEPWRTRLAEIQAQLKTVMGEASVVVRRNNRLMRRMLLTSNETLRKLAGDHESSCGYSTLGAPLAVRSGAPALLNQAG